MIQICKIVLFVSPIEDCAISIYSENFGKPTLATKESIGNELAIAAREVDGHNFSDKFLFAEWSEVVDAWHLSSWEEYRDVKRLGRKTRLAEAQRQVCMEHFRKSSRSFSSTKV